MEKKKVKLYLNMILAETEPVEMVKRSFDSVKDYIDGMYITITYSEVEPRNSDLAKLVEEYKGNLTFFKWIDDFAAARQFALNQIPRGSDIFLYWQDADDILKNADKLPLVIEDMVRYNQSAVYFPYWYTVELDEEGNVKEILVNQKRERIIRNDGTWEWKGDLHETLIEQRYENLNRIGREDLTVIHLSSNERGDKALERNIRILEKQIKKEKRKDPRTIVYLARAYLDKAKMTEMPERKINMDMALMLFYEYLEGSGKVGEEGYREPSGWREERGTAWGNIAEIAIMSGNPEVAVGAYQNAIDEAYEFPSYYVDLAMAYCKLKNYKKARHWLNLATSIPMPNTTIITFPRDLRLRASLVSLDINFNEQKLEEAREDAKKVLEITPHDESTKKLLNIIENLIDYNKACQSVIYLGKYLEARKEKDCLGHLVQAIPPDMQQEFFAAEMRHLFLPKRVWDKNEIAILCGPAFEKWSPKSVETGIGGSEEAVIHMAKELTKLGWKVTVYADPREESGEYDGVTYKQYYELNQKDEFNVLILWRSIGFVDLNPKSKYTILWLHDMPNNPDFTKERIDKIDKIAVLSEFHKGQIRMQDRGVFKPIPQEKIFSTSNGIPEIKFEWKGSPHKIAYMSSPDRGLIYLLNNWSEIRKEVPDAELNIFYGFDVFDALHKHNPAKMKWKEKVLELMNQPGIIYHKRIGHNALHYQLSRMGIWAYPTDFTEISCISAMKAQACGAIPVVTNYAALEETVKNGAKVNVDIRTNDGQKEYVQALITALKNVEWQDDIRKNMIPWARDYFSWRKVAETWDEHMRVHIQNPENRFTLKDNIEEGVIISKPTKEKKTYASNATVVA